MAGSLFNIAINIGEQPTILKEVLIPLISVFIGARFAYQYTLQRDTKQKKEQYNKHFRIIVTKANFLFHELMSYKDYMLSEIKPKFIKNTVKASIVSTYTPQVDFDESVDKTIFLSEFNPQFPYLISQVSKITQLFLTSVEIFKKSCFNRHLSLIQEGVITEDSVQNAQKEISNLLQVLDSAIVWSYILNDKLCKCYAKYFDDICDEKSLGNYVFAKEYEQYLPLNKKENYKIERAFARDFENLWRRQLTILEHLDFSLRKIKRRYKNTSYYFTFNKNRINK